ncbi:hypothetical protein OSO01_19360 [Oceanobacillus sojae]|uniref:Uncharacterized protein n=1 Tax=Oceanobacillus sojae TaxID=582851 RepID=A0A511ZID3_9BACI|nr:hypothetical protein OSO01_19360 [Oceanobacillus sojae]
MHFIFLVARPEGFEPPANLVPETNKINFTYIQHVLVGISHHINMLVYLSKFTFC